MTKFLNIIWDTLVEMQKVRTATALARMGKHSEAKAALL